MGFDLGALLRSGAAGAAGLQKGQQEREERERAAQRQALSDALLKSQTRNQQDAIRSRGLTRTRQTEQDRLAATELAQQQATQKAQADFFRQQFPELANIPDDGAVVARGTDMLTQRQALARDQARPRTTSTRDPDRQSFQTLRTEFDEAHRNLVSERKDDPLATLQRLRGEPLLTPADTTQLLENVRREIPEASPEQFETFSQSIQGGGQGGDQGELQSLRQEVQELLRLVEQETADVERLERER